MLDEKIKALSDDELEQVTGGVMSDEHKVPELNTLEQLNKKHDTLSDSLQRLSSGSKINPSVNSPSDFQISERMRGQIHGLDQANYNAQNGESLTKTAEGALSSTIDILQTLKEKMISAATDTNTEVDRAAIQKEIDNMLAQIDDNALTSFNGRPLIENQALRSALQELNAEKLVPHSTDGGGSSEVNSGLKVIDSALQRCLNQQASIGATHNRLDFTSDNLISSSENLQSAEITYSDADMAKQMTAYTKEQILQQTAEAMHALANQQEQGVLQLLQ